ncbi:hypothetical protein JCM9279_006454 [Rhodotorula babjevae]
MADIAIYALVGGITNLQERVSNFRSPVIPLSRTSTPPAPPPIPPHISRSADAQFLEGTLTEHGLELAHYSWAARHAALALRQYALKDAVQKNLIGCWAGLVRGQQGADNLRAVRLAVDEAAWVEERLQAALDWCAEQRVKKMKVSSMVQVRRGKRSTIVRPTHTSIPPTLLDLPFPLPLAPPSSRLAPFIPRPPPLLDTDTPDGDAHAGPPTYTREADRAQGESTLEGGFLEGELEVIAYEAGLLDDDDLSEAIRLLYVGTERVLLVLLHSFPDFLAQAAPALVDTLPPQAVHLKNLINSAFPIQTSVVLPDPLEPGLQLEQLPEAQQTPTLLTDPSAALQAAGLKPVIDSYLQSGEPATLPHKVEERLALKAAADSDDKLAEQLRSLEGRGSTARELLTSARPSLDEPCTHGS